MEKRLWQIEKDIQDKTEEIEILKTIVDTVPPKLYDPSKEKELTELEEQYAELEHLNSPVNFELEQELENAIKQMRRSIQKSKDEQKKIQ